MAHGGATAILKTLLRRVAALGAGRVALLLTARTGGAARHRAHLSRGRPPALRAGTG